MGNRGKREFIQVLRLLEAIPKEVVTYAVTEAIRLGAIGFDAVKQIALARIERRPARLDLTAYPHLPQTRVKTTSAADYAVLLPGRPHAADRASMRCRRERRVARQVLLSHHLKQLKLPTVLREYDKVARECARDGVDHPRYLLRLVELELIDRERRVVERRIKQARFPAVKSLDTFDFTAIPSLNKMLVLELARCESSSCGENVIALGNTGTGKTHVALALGLAACQKGFSVAFTTAAALVHQLMEARDERRLLRLQRELQTVKLLIVDELGYVPLSPDRRRAPVRGVLPALRARLDHRHLEPAVRGVDRGPRLRAAHRCAARPADPPRPYPDHERRQLPAQAVQAPPACPRRQHRYIRPRMSTNSKKAPAGAFCLSRDAILLRPADAFSPALTLGKGPANRAIAKVPLIPEAGIINLRHRT